MAEPIPAQKEPYGINVEAGKRYFWCACGRSANQPYCDGSHSDTVYRRGERRGLAVRLQADRRQAILRRHA
jgi:CDGSH-type Zn-finger protein